MARKQENASARKQEVASARKSKAAADRGKVVGDGDGVAARKKKAASAKSEVVGEGGAVDGGKGAAAKTTKATKSNSLFGRAFAFLQRLFGQEDVGSEIATTTSLDVGTADRSEVASADGGELAPVVEKGGDKEPVKWASSPVRKQEGASVEKSQAVLDLGEVAGKGDVASDAGKGTAAGAADLGGVVGEVTPADGGEVAFFVEKGAAKKPVEWASSPVRNQGGASVTESQTVLDLGGVAGKGDVASDGGKGTAAGGAADRGGVVGEVAPADGGEVDFFVEKGGVKKPVEWVSSPVRNQGEESQTVVDLGEVVGKGDGTSDRGKCAAAGDAADLGDVVGTGDAGGNDASALGEADLGGVVGKVDGAIDVGKGGEVPLAGLAEKPVNWASSPVRKQEGSSVKASETVVEMDGAVVKGGVASDGGKGAAAVGEVDLGDVVSKVDGAANEGGEEGETSPTGLIKKPVRGVNSTEGQQGGASARSDVVGKGDGAASASDGGKGAAAEGSGESGVSQSEEGKSGLLQYEEGESFYLQSEEGSQSEEGWDAGFPSALDMVLALNPAPCTLRPAPCTLHPALCTLNPEPCTLNPKP